MSSHFCMEELWMLLQEHQKWKLTRNEQFRVESSELKPVTSLDKKDKNKDKDEAGARPTGKKKAKTEKASTDNLGTLASSSVIMSKNVSTITAAMVQKAA